MSNYVCDCRHCTADRARLEANRQADAVACLAERSADPAFSPEADTPQPLATVETIRETIAMLNLHHSHAIAALELAADGAEGASKLAESSLVSMRSCVQTLTALSAALSAHSGPVTSDTDTTFTL